MPKEKKQTFMQGIITLMFSQILVKILGLGYKLYLTNKQGFGDVGNAIYSSSFQIYALFLTISSVGVPNAVSKLISEKYSIGDERGAKRIFKVAFAMFSIIGFCSSIILYIFAEYIAKRILEIPETAITLRILAPSIFFVSVISVLRGYFNAKENMKPTANSQIIEQFAKSVLTILIVEFIYFSFGTKNNTEIMVAGVGVAVVISSIVSLVYLINYYKKEQIIKKIRSNTEQERIITIIKKIITVSAPITISVILGTINKNIDSFTVVRGLKQFMTIEEAKTQYGILSGKVETLITLPMSLNVALTTSLIPAIAAAKSKNSLKSVENKILFSIILTVIIGMPSSVGMILYAQQILNLLFPNASSGAFIYQISSISIVFILLNQTITGMLQGLGKQFVPVISLLIGVIVKLMVNLILVRINPNQFLLGGVAGAATGTLLCYISSLLISSILLKNNLNMKIKDKTVFVKIIIATFCMALCSKITFVLFLRITSEKMSTIIAIFMAVIIYVFEIIKMKIIDIRELNFKKNSIN